MNKYAVLDRHLPLPQAHSEVLTAPDVLEGLRGSAMHLHPPLRAEISVALLFEYDASAVPSLSCYPRRPQSQQALVVLED